MISMFDGGVPRLCVHLFVVEGIVFGQQLDQEVGHFSDGLVVKLYAVSQVLRENAMTRYIS